MKSLLLSHLQQLERPLDDRRTALAFDRRAELGGGDEEVMGLAVDGQSARLSARRERRAFLDDHLLGIDDGDLAGVLDVEVDKPAVGHRELRLPAGVDGRRYASRAGVEDRHILAASV